MISQCLQYQVAFNIFPNSKYSWLMSFAYCYSLLWIKINLFCRKSPIMLSFGTWIGDGTGLCDGSNLQCLSVINIIWQYSWNEKGPGIDPGGTPHVTLPEFHIWDKDISALQVDPKSDEKWAREADPLMLRVPRLLWEAVQKALWRVILHSHSEKLVLNLGGWVLVKIVTYCIHNPKRKYRYTVITKMNIAAELLMTFWIKRSLNIKS